MAQGGPGLAARIETEDGWPVPGSVVTVTDLEGQQVAVGAADSEGWVTATLPAGPYTVIVSAPGFLPTARAVLVPAGGRSELGVLRLSRQPTAVPAPANGQWTIDPVHSSILITVHHLGLSGVKGRFNDFGGTIRIADPPEASTVDAVIRAESVDTGNKMRDDHLRSPDFLDVERFPTIRYQSTSVTPMDGDRWSVEGMLSLCEETRPVRLEMEYLGTGPDPWGYDRVAFHATTRLRRQDYGIRFSQNLATGIAIVGSTLQVELAIEAAYGDTVHLG